MGSTVRVRAAPLLRRGISTPEFAGPCMNYRGFFSGRHIVNRVDVAVLPDAGLRDVVAADDRLFSEKRFQVPPRVLKSHAKRSLVSTLDRSNDGQRRRDRLRVLGARPGAEVRRC